MAGRPDKDVEIRETGGAKRRLRVDGRAPERTGDTFRASEVQGGDPIGKGAFRDGTEAHPTTVVGDAAEDQRVLQTFTFDPDAHEVSANGKRLRYDVEGKRVRTEV